MVRHMSTIKVVLTGLRCLRRHLCLIACAGLLESSVAKSIEDEPLCFYADGASTGEICNGNDIAGLANDPEVRRVMETLGISNLKIFFSGCEKGLFATSSHAGVSTARIYNISYPLLRATPNNQGNGVESPYLAPITHELSHVLQIELSGGRGELLDKREILSIELGADFLSGIVFALTKSLDKLSIYETNLHLVGLYQDDKKNAHGTWEQRTIAFRKGAFLKPNPTQVSPPDADAAFESKLFKEVLDIAAFKISAAPPAVPPIKWDKISACSETLSLYKKLKSSSDRLLSSCRPAQNALEHATAKAYSAKFGMEPCILKESPSPLVDGFSCIQSREIPNMLDCIRPADKQVLSEQFTDKNNADGSKYMGQAAACGPGVDASVGIGFRFSSTLDTAFNFGFAYSRTIGPGIPAEGEMSHGLALVDKSITTSGAEAIEYISMFTVGSSTISPKIAAHPKVEIGSWQVELDEMQDLEATVNSTMKQKNLPGWMTSGEISIRHAPEAGPAKNTKEAQVQEWQSVLAKMLKQENFVQIPNSELKTPDGKDLFTAIQNMRSVPKTGGKAQPLRSDLSPNMYVFHAGPGQACMKTQPSDIVAYVAAMSPNPSDVNDYGSIALFLLGIGNCGTPNLSLKKYYRELVDNSMDAIKESLKDQK